MKTAKQAGAEVRPLYVSERDLAVISGISTKTLQGWRLRGIGMPWRRFGGAVRYSVQDFEKWAAVQPGSSEAHHAA
jgi:hypothetical protein